MDYHGDFQTFMHDVGEDRIFQMLVFKKMFTPYEQDKKFKDETVYTDRMQDIKIREVIQLENDIMLGVQIICDIDDLDEENRRLEYYLLSEIRLGYNPAVEKEYLDTNDYNDSDDLPPRDSDQMCE